MTYRTRSNPAYAWLFADNIAMYLAMGSSSESEILKKDSKNFEPWEKLLDMNFI